MIQVQLNAALVMIIVSLTMVLDKVGRINGALTMIPCGSWSIGRLVKVTKGSTHIHTGDKFRAPQDVVFVMTTQRRANVHKQGMF